MNGSRGRMDDENGIGMVRARRVEERGKDGQGDGRMIRMRER